MAFVTSSEVDDIRNYEYTCTSLVCVLENIAKYERAYWPMLYGQEALKLTSFCAAWDNSLISRIERRCRCTCVHLASITDMSLQGELLVSCSAVHVRNALDNCQSSCCEAPTSGHSALHSSKHHQRARRRLLQLIASYINRVASLLLLCSCSTVDRLSSCCITDTGGVRRPAPLLFVNIVLSEAVRGVGVDHFYTDVF